MRGKAKIVNSKDDAKAANLTDDRIIEMATISVRYDDAVYPEGYDRTLKEGDVGYIEPMERFEDEIDQSVLDRFGVKLTNKEML
tara:strand:+ start:436 stop:687 length:252 start_codon:yes stop_codon:yes gene_type:complete